MTIAKFEKAILQFSGHLEIMVELLLSVLHNTISIFLTD